MPRVEIRAIRVINCPLPMLASLRNLMRHRALLRALTLREVQARYRGSFLGFLWSFLNPMLLLAIYTFVFGYVMPTSGESPRPFGVFLFTGLLPWTWFSGALLESSWSIVHGGVLLRKVVFPAEVLPLVPVLANAIHFLVAMPVLMTVLAVYGHLPGWNALAVVPIFFIQLLMTAGLALVFSALSVLFRDVPQLLNHAIMIGFWLAPVVYVLANLKPELQNIVLLNPVTHLILGWHNALFFDRPPEWRGLLVTGVVSVLTAVLGYAFFDRLREVLPEEV